MVQKIQFRDDTLVYERAVLSAREAADLLAVTPQRVRQMIADGRLPAHRTSAGWLVPHEAVEKRADARPRGRPIGPRTAWAAIALLATAEEPARQIDDPADGLDRRLRHRVLGLLDGLPDPTENAGPWLRLLGARGETRHMWVHPGVSHRLVADRHVRVGGSRVPHAGAEPLSGHTGALVLYVASSDAEALIRRYRMRADPAGQARLIMVPDDLLPTDSSQVPSSAAAADLLEEDDPRARHAAARRLRSLRRALLRTRGRR